MLALIAGDGALPAVVAEAAGTPPLVANIKGSAPEGLTPAFEFSIDTLASFLKTLTDRGVTEVCFAGATRRENLVPIDVEPESRGHVQALTTAMQKGDDTVVTVLLDIFTQAGFTIRAPHDIAPDLLPPVGAATVKKPTRDDSEEAMRAREILAAMGAADIGQACVVHWGQALAVEGVFGTDWMLDSLANRPDGQGGLLYKAPKPGQDRRVDLPTIGPGTVTRAAAAGLTGVAIEEGGVIVLDRAATIAAADEAGIFLWVCKS